MIKIPSPSTRFRTEHLGRCEKIFRGVSDAHGFDAAAKTGAASATRLVTYFKTNLSVILVGSPPELRRIIREVEHNFPDFATYCDRRPRKNSLLFDAALDALCDLVDKLFDYDTFSEGGGGGGAYALIREYNQRLCPYCQLQFVNYHVKAGKGKLTMRPDLDHFYPKSKYPYLSISLCNLVPSCHQCNTSVKRTKDPRKTNLLHPLEQHPLVAVDYGCVSKLPPTLVNSESDFAISLKGRDPASDDFVDFFELAERYKWYGAEVMDVYRRYQRYLELDPSLRAAIRHEEYLLGYAHCDARQRIAGFMLSQMVRKLS
jgi:5-methylcytosine-specific restriction endonuclease McrA